MPDQSTLRVRNIPPTATENDVRSFFINRINRHRGNGRIVETVGPMCSQVGVHTKQTTVSFSSLNTAEKALALTESQREFTAQYGFGDPSSKSTLLLDEKFSDMTTLYEPINRQPNIDIVALHGLSGHAWRTFMTTISLGDNNSRETSWLRDILPSRLEYHNIYPRIMTYGYNANIWVDSGFADIVVPVNSLVSALEAERQGDERHRQLIFIGHSLGGIIAKQAITKMAEEARASGVGSPIPVKGCMFFGVPHLGSAIASDWLPILSLGTTAFNMNLNMIKDINQKSKKLAQISDAFLQVRNHFNIPVVSWYELQKVHRQVVVSQASATFIYDDHPRAYGIDSSHVELAKFANSNDQSFTIVIHNLLEMAREANAQPAPTPIAAPSLWPAPTLPEPQLAPKLPEPPLHTEPDKYSLLERFDTVFLVDDSGSMAGKGWRLIQQILSRATSVALKYDRNGIDIHFLNADYNNRNNVDSEAFVDDIVGRTRPSNGTPTFTRLEQELNSYIARWKDAGGPRSTTVKQLNLILLTDGEPDDDPDNAEIEQLMVETARELQTERAPKLQVGIQLCLIGNNEEAIKFFTRLDDSIRKDHQLDRDMIDMVQCENDEDLTEPFYLKLLTGAISKSQDKVILTHQSTTSQDGSTSPHVYSSPRSGQSSSPPGPGNLQYARTHPAPSSRLSYR